MIENYFVQVAFLKCAKRRSRGLLSGVGTGANQR